MDPKSVADFANNYYPSMDMIFVQINWDHQGALYYLPFETQRLVFDSFGTKEYLKLPKKGTNPRGVEIMRKALKQICDHPKAYKIPIDWKKTSDIDFNQFERWVDLWAKD